MAEYRELMGSPTEVVTPTGITATRRVQCAWDDRYLVLIELSNQIYPYHSFSDLLAREISIEPFESKITQAVPGDNTVAWYDEAVLTVNYEIIQGAPAQAPDQGNNPNGVTLFEETFEPSLEYLTVSGRKFWWHRKQAPGAPWPPVEESDFPAILTMLTLWKVVQYGMTSIPDWSDIQGKINDAPVYSTTLDKTFDTQTLLCYPPIVSRTMASDGTTGGWTGNFTFAHRPQTWNKFYWPDWEEYAALDPTEVTDPWNYMARNTTGYRAFYKTADFTPILPPPPA